MSKEKEGEVLRRNVSASGNKVEICVEVISESCSAVVIMIVRQGTNKVNGDAVTVLVENR